ncbi:hypothetical protein AVEN_64743-1 [Araneus ventricosus]|uniref:Uncharacterized protein n=1 Tax=Araneus ventricosus TaxID=182803 RepID=A0A4Y2UCN9_ARAVE|nr:hypothetical protein AVEN_64743-1 [Araneus ventricosus]
MRHFYRREEGFFYPRFQEFSPAASTCAVRPADVGGSGNKAEQKADFSQTMTDTSERLSFANISSHHDKGVERCQEGLWKLPSKGLGDSSTYRAVKLSNRKVYFCKQNPGQNISSPSGDRGVD